MSWKNGLLYAAAAVATVLVSFIVEWHIRTSWRIFWLDGLIRWWGDFVMFGWVKDYQTLVGGFLALGAGAFVMLSAVYQRRSATIDAIRQSRVDLEAQLAHAAIAYRRLLHQLRGRHLEDALTTLRSLEGVILSLATQAPPLANWLIRVNQLLDKHLVKATSEASLESDWPGASDNKPRKMALGYATLAVEYLSFTANMVGEDGRFVHVPRDRAETEDRLKSATGFGLENFAYSDFVIS